MREKFEKFFNSLPYEIFVGVLAAIAVSITLADTLKNISGPIFTVADIAITVIFIFDYLLRFLISKNKIDFVKSNIFDLIAILPFNSIFKAFRFVRLFKLVRLAKMSKMTKLFALTARLFKRFSVFFNTNGFKYMLMVTMFFIILGAIGIYFAEGMTFSDALWWSFVTTTTVGYGDLSPTTNIGRIIAVILMLIGIGLVGSLTSTITTYFLNGEKENKSYKSEILQKIKQKIDDFDNLTSDDIEDICKTLKALKKE